MSPAIVFFIRDISLSILVYLEIEVSIEVTSIFTPISLVHFASCVDYYC